jgi:hypothetical protein
MARKLSRYRCAVCGRRLPEERWVFSTWTRNRYCWPSEGCSISRTTKGAARPPKSGQSTFLNAAEAAERRFTGLGG